jgi:hypothetical protein
VLQGRTHLGRGELAEVGLCPWRKDSDHFQGGQQVGQRRLRLKSGTGAAHNLYNARRATEVRITDWVYYLELWFTDDICIAMLRMLSMCSDLLRGGGVFFHVCFRIPYVIPPSRRQTRSLKMLQMAAECCTVLRALTPAPHTLSSRR